MNLGDLADNPDNASAQDSGLVLHEFGHALALEHEHQSPEAKCDEEFNWPVIYQKFKSDNGWDSAKVDRNIRGLSSSPRLRTSAYDKRSIMHYYFPAWMYNQGSSSRCFAPHNTVLSSTDKQILKESYPASASLQLAEINRRGDLAKHVLAKVLGTPEQTKWAEDLVDNATSLAAPNFSLNLTASTSVKNEGQCAGADLQQEAGDGSAVVQCANAKGDIDIRVGVPPPSDDND